MNLCSPCVDGTPVVFFVGQGHRRNIPIFEYVSKTFSLLADAAVKKVEGTLARYRRTPGNQPDEIYISNLRFSMVEQAGHLP